jgi:hypothetical protein
MLKTMYQNTLILGSGSNYFHFNTSAATGAPITLAGTPSLACRVNGGTSATAGLTLSVDHGTVTGLHRVAVDVDDATLTLADGDVVEVYIAAGTVDGVSVVGKLLAVLAVSDGSLLAGTITALRAALGLASANLDTQLAGIVADTENIQSRIPAALNNGCIPADVQRVDDVAVAQGGAAPASPYGV